MNIGDFVEATFTLDDGQLYEKARGRILAVQKDHCLVWASGLVVKVLKSNIKVTLKVEDHVKIVQADLAKIPYDEDY